MDLHKTLGSYNLALDAHRHPTPAPCSQISTKPLVKQNKSVSAKHTVKAAVVIFCDLSKFQQFTAQYGDITCSSIVESLFTQFDGIASPLQLTPLKTNGDQYIAVSFCADDTSSTTSLSRCVRNTIEFALKARNLVSSNPVLFSSSCQLRVGIATGSVVFAIQSLCRNQSQRPRCSQSGRALRLLASAVIGINTVSSFTTATGCVQQRCG